MKNKNKRTLLMGIVLSILVLMIGGTYALWEWYTTSEKYTFVDFTVTPTFSCGANGGGAGGTWYNNTGEDAIANTGSGGGGGVPNGALGGSEADGIIIIRNAR